MNNYFPLIKFTIVHDYYINGKCKDAGLIWYQGKKEAEKNYKLLLRKQQQGEFILFINGQDNFKERFQFLLNDLSDGFCKMSFILKSTNPYFTSFTKAIDVKSNNQLYTIEIPLKAAASDPLSYRVAMLEKTAGNTAFEKEILKLHPEALIHITPHVEMDNPEELLKRIQSGNPIDVTIRFEAKSTTWRYVFLSRTNQAPDLSVVDSNQIMNFSKIDWAESINNTRAGISYSEKAIPLAEKYPFHFQLWKNYFNGKRLIVDRLPFPDPSHNGNYYLDDEINYITIYQYF